MSKINVNNIEANDASTDITVTTGGSQSLLVDTNGKLTVAGNLSVNGNNYPSAGPLSNRNLIINGAMNVAQRGTSQTSQNASGYLCDRFAQTLNSYGVWTREQSTDAPDGFANSFKLTCTTADTSPSSTDYTRVSYIPEAQDLQPLSYGTANAKDVTVSFWVKSNVAATYVFWMYQTDSPTTRQINKLYTIDAVDTWEYKTITIEGDTSGQIDNDTGNGMIIGWILSSGSGYTSGTRPSTWTDHTAADRWVGLTADVGGAASNYFQITGVQLEVGDTATPFEHRSYGDELARCQRYYQIGGGVYFRTYQVGSAYAGQGFELKTTMRVTPSYALGGNATWSTTNISGTPVVAPERADHYYTYALWTATGDGRFQTTSGTYFTFDAEL